ncbi:MAG TPA: ADP-ribosylglycohydrolase family protein, partial [Nevskiaceae bacterium]|nr:ADP-ribosylglycohydrolase family protein [Nevskiaceae bacterium]
WGTIGGLADNTEAAERALAIGVRYARDPQQLARSVSGNTVLTQVDPTIGAMTTAYCAALGLVVAGTPFDANISTRLMALVRSGQLPFHTVTTPGENAVPKGPEAPYTAGHYASPDALIGMGYIARAAADPGVKIEPAWKVSLVYGMPCAVYHQFPAVYYLAARFANDFEAAVLNAINGGGQNQARAMLTGALVGAQVGIDGIPKRFLDGLDRASERMELARAIAAEV